MSEGYGLVLFVGVIAGLLLASWAVNDHVEYANEMGKQNCNAQGLEYNSINKEDDKLLLVCTNSTVIEVIEEGK